MFLNHLSRSGIDDGQISANFVKIIKVEVAGDRGTIVIIAHRFAWAIASRLQKQNPLARVRGGDRLAKSWSRD
ncbi:MAG: hypothetical protein AB4352_03015 [Hormoscilla sp.]